MYAAYKYRVTTINQLFNYYANMYKSPILFLPFAPIVSTSLGNMHQVVTFQRKVLGTHIVQKHLNIKVPHVWYFALAKNSFKKVNLNKSTKSMFRIAIVTQLPLAIKITIEEKKIKTFRLKVNCPSSGIR